MINRIIYIFLLLAFSSTFAVSISGKIFNSSADSATVKNHAVSLQRMSATDHAPVQLEVSQTNRTGTFQFHIDKIDTAITYFTSTDYQGVRYYSDAVVFSGSNGSINLVVQDSTHSTANIQTLMHHLMIEDMGSTVVVRETRVHQNSGNTTILEVFESQQGKFLAKTALPGGASAFQPMSEQLQNELFLDNGIIYDTGIMPPGNRQVGYTYHVPWKKNAVMFQIPLSYASRNFDVFINNPNIQIVSQDLQDRGPFTIRGTTYQRYGANEIPANTVIRFALQRSKKAASMQSPMFAVVLTSVLLVLALVLTFSQSRKSKK